MQPKTEEFLNLLLWSAEMLARPTFRNLTSSYEDWAYRKGFWRQVQSLHLKKLIERDGKSSTDRVYRLTEEGRLHALGGRDPKTRWSRAWDGRWRIVLFDVPVEQNARRVQLRRYLHHRNFGCLQDSVWVSPDPVVEEREILGDGDVNVRSLLLLEAQPCAGESDQQIVEAAWDFQHINSLYRQHVKVLDDHPKSPIATPAAAAALQRWGAEERKAWLAAVSADPLLPERLLPENYLGRQAWKRRMEALHQAGEQIRAFKPPV